MMNSDTLPKKTFAFIPFEKASERALPVAVVETPTTDVLEAYNTQCIEIIEAQGELSDADWKAHLQSHFFSDSDPLVS